MKPTVTKPYKIDLDTLKSVIQAVERSGDTHCVIGQTSFGTTATVIEYHLRIGEPVKREEPK